MAPFDLVIRGGTLVRPEVLERADLAVAGGVIVEIAPELRGRGAEEVDATDLHLFPGVVDPHVHFNEPGRAAWEGIASGSRAFAAGGGTTYCDMPLNSDPPTLDTASFATKRRAAQAASRVDFGLWGGLVPHNLSELPALAAAGAVGVKAFMTESGLDEFPAVDDATLQRGMEIAARVGLLVAVHAERRAVIHRLTAAARQAGLTSARDFLRSRPIQAELEAIRCAIQLARETGVRLHIVHVSSGRGVALVAQARAAGVDVTCETCPHYLLFTDEDVERLGAIAKCAPPIRDHAEREALWRWLHQGEVDMIVSDHSPCPPELKQGQDFFALWGGIAGVQSTLPLLLAPRARGHYLTLGQASWLMSEAPARRFGFFPRKGRLEVGADADLTLLDLRASYELEQRMLLYRHPQSPFVGLRCSGRVRRTIVRGITVLLDDGSGRPPVFPAGPVGTLIVPRRAARCT